LLAWVTTTSTPLLRRTTICWPGFLLLVLVLHVLPAHRARNGSDGYGHVLAGALADQAAQTRAGGASAFGRAFRRRCGSSPTQWRKVNQVSQPVADTFRRFRRG